MVRTLRLADAVEERERKALAAEEADGSSSRAGMVRVVRVYEAPCDG